MCGITDQLVFASRVSSYTSFMCWQNDNSKYLWLKSELWNCFHFFSNKDLVYVSLNLTNTHTNFLSTWNNRKINAIFMMSLTRNPPKDLVLTPTFNQYFFQFINTTFDLGVHNLVFSPAELVTNTWCDVNYVTVMHLSIIFYVAILIWSQPSSCNRIWNICITEVRKVWRSKLLDIDIDITLVWNTFATIWIQTSLVHMWKLLLSWLNYRTMPTDERVHSRNYTHFEAFNVRFNLKKKGLLIVRVRF